jgi:hypothetical protein
MMITGALFANKKKETKGVDENDLETTAFTYKGYLEDLVYAEKRMGWVEVAKTIIESDSFKETCDKAKVSDYVYDARFRVRRFR